MTEGYSASNIASAWGQAIGLPALWQPGWMAEMMKSKKATYP